jgi:hypothetical protein
LLDGLSLFDRLSLTGFFGDRFVLLDAKPFIKPAAHVLDGGGEPLHG